MKKQVNTAIAGLILATTSMTAMATEVGGTYVTAGMISMELDGLNQYAAAGITIDDSDRAPTFGIGYQVDKNLSFEAGVIGEMESSISGAVSSMLLYDQTLTISGTATIKAKTDTSYTLGVRYLEPVNEKLDLYGKAGMLFWDLTGSVSVDGTIEYNGTEYALNESADVYKNDGKDLYFGIGGSYELVKGTSINAEYIKTEIDDDDIDALSMTIEFDI